ncbi:MAG: hypothetical protein AAFR49_20435, partial [Pseudomonadota bacterium]
ARACQSMAVACPDVTTVSSIVISIARPSVACDRSKKGGAVSAGASGSMGVLDIARLPLSLGQWNVPQGHTP